MPSLLKLPSKHGLKYIKTLFPIILFNLVFPHLKKNKKGFRNLRGWKHIYSLRISGSVNHRPCSSPTTGLCQGDQWKMCIKMACVEKTWETQS